MAQPKSRLGRGLGNLISGGVSSSGASAKKSAPAKVPAAKKKTASTKAAPTPEAEVPISDDGFTLIEVDVAKVVTSPYQPRREFRQEQIMELAHSIRAEGLLQPIVVRKNDKMYELIAGERRWRAFQFLKIRKIPARIIRASDASSAALSLIENLQREGLNPIEEALGYSSLIRDFDLTQEGAAERVGKGRATVANALRLLTLDTKLQAYLAKGMLSTGHAKVLLSLQEPAHREFLAQRIIENSMSVRETEREVKRLKEGKSIRKAKEAGGANSHEDSAIENLQRKLTSEFNTTVSLKHSAKKGKLIIEYHGNDDLQRILDRMGVNVG